MRCGPAQAGVYAAAGRKDYEELLVMMYHLFRTAQSTGAMALEPHFDNPQESAILSNPSFLARHGSVAFLADSVRIIIVGGVSTHDFEHLMYEDLEDPAARELWASNTLLKVGDALPVSASWPRARRGHHDAGHRRCAGGNRHKVGAPRRHVPRHPVVVRLRAAGGPQPGTSCARGAQHRAGHQAGILALHKGFAPAIAVEFARRCDSEEVRPSFEETEELCRNARSDSAAMAA
jgi:chemotaxis protein MotA